MQDGAHFTATRLVRAGQNDQVFCKWPPRSPDLTVCDFFLWGYVKDRVYVPPLPATMDELQDRITDMLQRVWSELDYRIDVCQVTRRGHIECVWYQMKLWVYATVATNFVKNISVSFDFITTWNQGRFLWSPCICMCCACTSYSLWMLKKSFNGVAWHSFQTRGKCG